MTTKTKSKVKYLYVFDPDKTRKLMKERSMSVTGLATAAGVSRVSASLWLSGATVPCYESLQRMAFALELDGIADIVRKVRM